MVNKRVRGAAVGVGVTVGVLLLAIWASRRFNVGGQITEGLGGFGKAVGESLTAVPKGILSGISSGAGGLGEEAISLSEGFQRSVSQTLGGGFNLFSEFGQGQGQNTEKQGTIPTASGASLSFAELLNTLERDAVDVQKFDPQGAQSIINLNKSLLSGFNVQTNREALKQSAGVIPQDSPLQAALKQIRNVGNLVNPSPQQPTVGVFKLPFDKGSVSESATLSQQAVDFYKKLGIDPTRIL